MAWWQAEIYHSPTPCIHLILWIRFLNYQRDFTVGGEGEMNKNNVIFIIWHEIIQINPCMKLDTDTPLPFMTPAECPMLHIFNVKQHHRHEIKKEARDLYNLKYWKLPSLLYQFQLFLVCLFLVISSKDYHFFAENLYSFLYSSADVQQQLHWTERHFAKPNLVRDPCGAEGVRLQYFISDQIVSKYKFIKRYKQ